MSLFVISEILGLGLFLNTLTADHEYSLCNRENLSRSIQRQFSQKSKVFLNFFLHFWNLHQILNFFLEKMTLIVHLFPKLWTAKDLVRKISKKPCFGTSFERQYAKRSQKLLKSARQYFYHFFLSLLEKWSWKIFLLVISEILGLLVNTLTTIHQWQVFFLW